MLEKLRPYRWWLLGLAVLLAAGGTAAAVYLLAPLKQGDSRWGRKLLGQSSKTTIAGAGCLLTTMTMGHNLLWKNNLTPDVANDLILAQGGFSGANMVYAGAARALGLTFDDRKRVVTANPAAMAAHCADTLRRGGFCSLHVTYDEDPEGDHFILVTRQLPDGRFEVYDPGPGIFTLDPLLQGRTPRGVFYTPVACSAFFRDPQPKAPFPRIPPPALPKVA